MAEPERPERGEIRVTDIKDPLQDATFGSIGRYVEVAGPDGRDEPFMPQRLVLGFDEKQATHVDPYTLTLFEVDLETRTFTPVSTSRVYPDERRVEAWIDHAGTYGVIGLPTHQGVLETLRLLDRFAPELIEERERGENAFQERICGLILCADPTIGGGGPLPPGDLCGKCLGLDVSFERLPERFLWEREIPLRPFREFVPDEPEPPAMPKLLAWGRNAGGTLGDGTKIQRNSPVFVAGLDVRKIVGSTEFTLALATDGGVWAWGTNYDGELGNGTRNISRTTPGRVAGGATIPFDGVVDIAAGFSRALAVRSDGSVWTWGRDAVTGGFNSLPVRVSGIVDAVAVACGADFNLALDKNNRVWSWGINSSGQLGNGTFANRTSPGLVPGLTAVRSIAAASAASYAIKSNGAVVAWGAGSSGLLGNGGTSNSSIPVAVPNLSNIEQVSAGFHGLARTTAGDVWVWGTCADGNSGDGTSFAVHLTPVQIAALQDITAIAAGFSHDLALQADGTVWAWGRPIEGQVGDGMVSDGTSPVAVPLPAGQRGAGVGAGTDWSFAILG
jgi:alpha-tubulin suppressor-like RCC1 family protein